MAVTHTVTSATRSRAVSDRMLFALTFAGFVIWDLGGHIDVWYHQHYGFAIESFLTLPHAALYFGWIASAVPAAAYLLESRALRLPRSAWLPPGYALVLAAAAAFGVGGGFDLWWHSTFGFEVNHEALVSPSHLVLICSAGLGYFGFVWVTIDRRRRERTRGFATDLVVAVSLGMLFRHALYALFYIQPFATDYASGGSLTGSLFGFAGITAWHDMTAQVAGTGGIVLYAMLLSLFVVVPLRRLRLAAGAVTVIVLWNEAWNLVGIPEMWVYLPAVIVSAIVGEGLWSAMGRGALGGRDARTGYWAIGAGVPTTLFIAYFALMATLGGGITWTTPLWAGAPVLAGIYGLVATVFAIPPRFAGADDV
jgi:hypothetical protein